jgi:alanine-glyoxylate transaminase/serine-glyoxylate transaminase/serine-pyruvate transaminase
MHQVGHMDPAFLSIVEETQEMLRYVWQTKNHFTIPVSGTGRCVWTICNS